MKILTLLLHDERFSGWTVEDKIVRQHFSIQYLRFYKQKCSEPLLYTFHEQVKSTVTRMIKEAGIVKIFPVGFRFPPFLRFGNDHSPSCVMREMCHDEPDLVHFHNYYLSSFPYVASFVKRVLKRPLIAQLHGYENDSVRKWFYLPCLLALKHADRILYSYAPEKRMYEKLGVSNSAVKLPVPGVDPQMFRPAERGTTNRLLYVGRIPSPRAAHGEKFPFVLIRILKRLKKLSKDVSLDIVGDGPGLGCGRKLARDLKVADSVAFHDYVPYSELPRYYRASALTLSPMQIYDVDGWFDGSIQESLACGTPVAAFKISSETPLQGTYGFLLSRNEEKAAEELQKLLKNQDETNEVAMEGSRFVRENCSYEKVASKLEKTLESVLCT